MKKSDAMYILALIAIVASFLVLGKPQLFEKNQAAVTAVPTATTSQQVWDYVGTFSPGEGFELSTTNSVNISAYDSGYANGHVAGCNASMYSRDTYVPAFVPTWTGEKTFDYSAGTVKLLCLGDDGRVKAYIRKH